MLEREAIRILVRDIGYSAAAKQTGLKRDRLYKWGQRYGWKTPIVHAQGNVQTVQSIPDAHAAQLAEDEAETRASLSRAARQMAKDCETLPVKHSDKALNVGKLAGITHKWDAKQGGQANVMVNVAILGIDPDSVRAESDIIDQA